MKIGIVAAIKRIFLVVMFSSSYGIAADLQLAEAPLDVTARVDPNVMLLIDTSGSMGDPVAGSDKSRMQVAKEVARDIIDNNPGVRFGLAQFYGPRSHEYGHGATIDYECASDAQSLINLKAKLASYKPATNTPLAEALYEITRYFRGESSYYHPNKTYSSPVQYRCQKNFTIVITDGLPTKDTDFPTDEDFESELKKVSLPDWDGKSPSTDVKGYPDFPQYSDGWGEFFPKNIPSNRRYYRHPVSGQGAALYLDDLAKFAWELDLKKTGQDEAGGKYGDTQQNIHTYTIGFTTANQMLEDAAEYGHGKYYTANDADELTAALNNALADIKTKSSSSASVAANSGRVKSGSRIFQARYSASDWSGQLFAFDIITDPVVGEVGQLDTSGDGAEDSAWEASSKIPGYASRVIITNKNEKGIAFNWDEITEAELSNSFDGEDQLLYLRGKNSPDYRQRSSKLGDIVNSAPVYVGQPDARYRNNIETTSYKSFRQKYRARAPIVYVGANDGMLHGFDAASGAEKLAYIPGHLLPKLKHLAGKDYRHQYYVDGSPTVVDAFVGGEWKTILVGGLNVGGQSIYALDVTNPQKFSQDNADDIFLWEFTDQDDADLGFTFSKPAIVKMHDGNWYAVFGNGYNNTAADGAASETGDAVIFIVDLATGKLTSKITTQVGRAEDPTGQERPNGMATLTPVDINGDTIADAIYGGDLFGNIWKFNVSSRQSANWRLGSKLFTACAAAVCGDNYLPQPITTKLTVNRFNNRNIVFFGTGKYIETTDANTDAAEIQSFYGIWDEGEGFSGRTNLLQQQITRELTQTYHSDQDDKQPYEYRLRTTSDNKPSGASRGWYLDLVTPVVGADAERRGERVINRPLLRHGRVIFVTTVPGTDPCSVGGGSSWLMELDQETGGLPGINLFDLNNDGIFNSEDSVSDNQGGGAPVSGIGGEGSSSAPRILGSEKNPNEEQVYIGNGLGDITVLRKNAAGNNGRQKWLQFTR
ncbi:MAG: PilC/PilY family type IV pilus protein [Amphritea sp.]